MNWLDLTYVAVFLVPSLNSDSPFNILVQLLEKVRYKLNAHLLLEGLDLLRLGSPFARPISTRWTVIASPITKKQSQTISLQAKKFQKYIIIYNSHL